jgi:hypothetical protein
MKNTNNEIKELTTPSVIPQKRMEMLISTANGHPDNECVIAARRLLEKKGIDWKRLK